MILWGIEKPGVRLRGDPRTALDLLGAMSGPSAESPGQSHPAFWRCDRLGPSTTFLLRHLAALLDEHPDGVDVLLEDAAVRLGLGMKGGASSPFLRSLGRLAQFRLSQPLGPDALQVRRRLPTLTRTQITRLPPGLRDEHDTWQHQTSAEPTPEQRRTRARRLALSLLELGEDPEAVEQQLHRWQIHPALAHESLRWAQLRRGLPHSGARPIPPPPTPADHHADQAHPTSPAAIATSFGGTITPADATEPDPVPVPPRPAA